MVACGVMADEGDAVPPGMEVMRDQMEYTAPDGTARAATTLATASMNTATRSATTGRPRIRQAVHGREPTGSLWKHGEPMEESPAGEHHPLAPRLSQVGRFTPVAVVSSTPSGRWRSW